jgi:hypothetical protein
MSSVLVQLAAVPEMAALPASASSWSLNLRSSRVKEEEVVEEGGKVWTPDSRLWRITFCSFVRLNRSGDSGGMKNFGLTQAYLHDTFSRF